MRGKLLLLMSMLLLWTSTVLAGPNLQEEGEVSGILTLQDKKYYVGSTLIDIGNAKEKVDLNQDEVEKSLKEEIADLVGKEVKIKGKKDTKKSKDMIYATSINGVEFENSKIEREIKYQASSAGGEMRRVSITNTPSIIERND